MAGWASFVAIGDSFTEGLDDRLGDGAFRGWADLVAAQLAATTPGMRYANLAIRGRLLDAVVAEQVPVAIRMAPDLVSFAAGGNDVLRRGYRPDRVHATLDRVVGDLTATGATVLMFTAADVTTMLPRILRTRLGSFNNVLRVVAGRHRATLIDLSHDLGFRHIRMWSEDRLHLSSYGHQRVACRVLEALGQPYHLEWLAELPPVPRASRVVSWQADLRWARQHLLPWVYRRLTGRSSGDTVRPKRPELAPVFSDEQAG